ncbi:MAG: ATP-binding cassette domain-containing protein, partial [Nitrospiraceae bacterium]|nr:ATP-binding cassette domain-containing protein [Nitrospiraceae bacterium]
MVDVTPNADYNTRNLAKAKGGAWSVYVRLVGYALHYKFRLGVSLLFAVVVAVSFSSVILGVGAVVKLLYVNEAVLNEQIDKMVTDVNGTFADLEHAINWSPDLLDAETVRQWAQARRADRGNTLGWLSALLVLVALMGGLARFVQEFFAGGIGASISVQLGEEMFANIMRLPIAFYERRSTGEILARFTNDMFMVNRGLASTFVKLFREPIKIVFCFALALAVDWQVTLTVLVVLPAIILLIAKIGKKLKRSVRRSLQRIAAMASVGAETINGILIVKAYSMEDYEAGRVTAELRRLRHYLTKMVKFDAAISPVTEFLLSVGLVVFILLANQAVESNRLDGGDLVILLGSLLAMMDPLRKLASVNNMIQTSVASAERVFEFIDLKSDIVEVEDAIDLPVLSETLRFENVRFAYNDDGEVLKGIDFEIEKGEMVALVGFSGAGKSTIVKLIPRFYDVSSGAVLVDGIDIRKATFRSLRDQIGIVTQDTILFNESIRDNIAFGQESYSPERVREAAVAANAAEFIERLPKGYDTVIGESGGTLSGGQRQRLAIARAIIKDPAILILDEATSSLDSESEHAIQKAIEEFIVGRTTIVIAHRLSTVQKADRILVVE